MITSEEMATAGVTTIYEAIQRLRPDWLTNARTRSGGNMSRTDELQVYYETTHYGTIESLHQLPVGGVHEVRLLSAADATTRFGTGNSGGAIVVVMTRQP